MPQTPALAPLVLDPDTPYSVHAQLSGIAVDAEISVWIAGALSTRQSGALLWTHFGVSGPAVLNVSRHWARARSEQRPVRLTLNFHPGSSFEEQDALWIKAAADRPRASVRGALSALLPDAVTQAILGVLHIPADRTLAALAREDRRRLVHALTDWPLPVGEILDVDGRIGGFNFQWAWSSARTAARGIGRAWDASDRIRTAAGP